MYDQTFVLSATPGATGGAPALCVVRPAESPGADRVLRQRGQEVFVHLPLGEQHHGAMAAAFLSSGLSCLSAIDGPALIVAWDQEQERLTMARDLSGRAALYYTTDGGAIWVSNDLHALTAATGTGDTLSPTGVELYLALGFVPAPFCILEGISKVPAGCVRTLDAMGGGTTTGLVACPELPKEDSADLAEETRFGEMLEKAFGSATAGNSGVALLLSGGIDSSILAWMLSRSGIPCETLAVDLKHNDTAERARKVARLTGLSHTTMPLPPVSIERYVDAMGGLDEPLADSLVYPLTCLFRQTPHADRLFLSGVGADSLFGGLTTHLALDLLIEGGGVTERVRECLGDLQAATVERELASLSQGSEFALAWLEIFTAVPHHVRERLMEPAVSGSRIHGAAEWFVRDWFRGTASPSSRAFRFDAEVPMADSTLQILRQTARHGDCRQDTPFLGNALLDYSRRLPRSALVRHGLGKRPLRQWLRERLPSEIWSLPKIGFSLHPGHLLGDHRGDIEDLLFSEAAGPWAHAFIQSWIRRFFEGPEADDYRLARQIWVLVALHAWLRARANAGRALHWPNSWLA